MLLDIRSYYALLVCLMASQVIFFSVHNPLSITLSREIFIVLMFFSTIVFFVKAQAGKIWVIREDVYWLLLMLFAALLSSICAMQAFGQPIYMGMIESRRIFEGLVYFYIVFKIRRNEICETDIARMFLFAAVICIVLGVIADKIGAAQSNKSYNANDFRADRIGIGLHCVALSIVYATTCVAQGFKGVFYRLFILIGWVYIVAFGQSRQVMVATLLMTLLIFRKNLKAYFWVLFLLVLILALFVLNDDIYDRFANSKLFLMFSDQKYTSGNLEDSSRGLAYLTVFSEIQDRCMTGCGALSSMFNGGFDTVYGSFFFLADIGFVGLLYQYGIWLPLPFGVTIYLMYRAYRKTRYRPELKFLRYWLLYLLILIPTAAPLEYRSAFMALIFAMAFARTRNQSHPVKANDRQNPQPNSLLKLN